MGGCTSKPKVLKDYEAPAPEPAPEKVIEEEKRAVAIDLASQRDNEKLVEDKKEVVLEAPESDAVNLVVDKVDKGNEAIKDSDNEKAKFGEEQTAGPEIVDKNEDKQAMKAENTEKKVKYEEEQLVGSEKVENKEVKPATNAENAAKEVKIEEEKTVGHEKMEKEEVKPPMEVSSNEPVEETKITEIKKKDEVKREPENIPIISFFTSLMGQKH